LGVRGKLGPEVRGTTVKGDFARKREGGTCPQKERPGYPGKKKRLGLGG